MRLIVTLCCPVHHTEGFPSVVQSAQAPTGRHRPIMWAVMHPRAVWNPAWGLWNWTNICTNFNNWKWVSLSITECSDVVLLENKIQQIPTGYPPHDTVHPPHDTWCTRDAATVPLDKSKIEMGWIDFETYSLFSTILFTMKTTSYKIYKIFVCYTAH